MSFLSYVKLMKGKSFVGILKGIRNVSFHQTKKFLLYIAPAFKMGVTDNSEKKLIVSLTSFPPRINTVYYCIKSLLNQSYKPDAVILWLAEEQFPKGEKDLPKKLLSLKKHGLSILWCSDIRSYKKIIPALEMFPNADIVTADDDVYYSRDWLKGLVLAHEKNPDNVCCYRAARIVWGDTLQREHPAKNVSYSEATYLHQQTGVGGVYYPKGCFYHDVTDEKIFMRIAPTNDDLWLWFMNILSGHKIEIENYNDFELFYVGNSQKVALTTVNDHGEMLYNSQLEELLRYYPAVRDILREEQQAMCK